MEREGAVISPDVVLTSDLLGKRRAALEEAILQALPGGWTARTADHMEWVIESTQYDLGYFEIRLTVDLKTPIFVHSNDIHIFPVTIEGATVVHLDAFTIPELSRLLDERVRTCGPEAPQYAMSWQPGVGATRRPAGTRSKRSGRRQSSALGKSDPLVLAKSDPR
jgi:hypothetical protein